MSEMAESELLCGWPPCPTPDCEYGVCSWAGTGRCHPCSVAIVGEAEMIRRYNATHDITWEEATALDEAEDEEDEGDTFILDWPKDRGTPSG